MEEIGGEYHPIHAMTFAAARIIAPYHPKLNLTVT
jgi:hypothetical protein